MTTSSGNRNSAALFVVLIPLVLGLQMAALWVMANASTSEPEITPLTSLAYPQEEMTDFEEQGVVNPAVSALAIPASDTEAADEPENTLPRMETGLASNVMIPMALESTPASTEPDQATSQNSPNVSQQPAVEETTSSPSPTEEPADQESGLQTPDWLQTRPADYYTLQVERFSDLDALQAFTERVSLPQPQAYYLQTTGRTWYVLVAGEYTDQQAALQTAAELTQQHPAVKPWVRRFRKIQAQLP